jgi:hypothetical protein
MKVIKSVGVCQGKGETIGIVYFTDGTEKRLQSGESVCADAEGFQRLVDALQEADKLLARGTHLGGSAIAYQHYENVCAQVKDALEDVHGGVNADAPPHDAATASGMYDRTDG